MEKLGAKKIIETVSQKVKNEGVSWVFKKIYKVVDNKIDEFALAKLMEKKVNKPDSYIKEYQKIHQGDYRTIFKVRVGKDNTEKALSIVSVKWDIDGVEQNEYINKIKKTREWYDNFLGKYVNKERFFQLTKDKNRAILIQDWINQKTGYEEIFRDIPNNLDGIISMAEKDEKFKKEVSEFAKKVLEAYKESGILPDIFNYQVGNPANILYSDKDEIKIIDLHLAFSSEYNCKDIKDEYSFAAPKSNIIFNEDFDKALEVFEKLSKL